MPLSFRSTATDGLARVGVMLTDHGPVETPAFMPVGTQGAVRGLGPGELEGLGAQVMLANLYHLRLRPGIQTIVGLGGVHRFTGWRGPILTDSGGFQVFSLAHRRRLDRDGVTFSSHVDGERIRLTPEIVVEWQQQLGVDIAMVLDECPAWPVERGDAEHSWELSLAWARRARAVWSGEQGALFGIVQGSAFEDLRRRAVAELVEVGFDGYAIGGVSVGEPAAERRQVVEWCAPALPPDRPRYLMGVGYPADILHAVRSGVDLFDCVLPARSARHGLLFTSRGTLKLKHARLKDDDRPVDPECGCSTCTRVPRALLHHLVRHEPLSAKVLGTVHNVRFYLDFMRRVRQAIASRTLADLEAPAGDAD